MIGRLRVMFLLALLALAGCPKKGPHFDPREAPDVPTAGSAQARTRFLAARAQFERDEIDQAAVEFERIRKEFPDDPIAPYATLYAGMADFRRGDHGAAAAALQPVVDDPAAPEEVKSRARFYLGLADAYLGKHEAARALLEPFAGKVEEGEDRVELYAALAESAAALGDVPAALVWYDGFFAGARPAERAYVIGRVRALVEALDEPSAKLAWEKVDKRGVSAAFLGRRLAASARAAGDATGARRYLDESRGAREAAGLRSDSAGAGAGNPALVGALLPLSGKRRLVGEVTLRGLALASGTFDRAAARGVLADKAPKPFEVVTRDAGEKDAATGVDELAKQGAIAIIGPTDVTTAAEAGRRATDLAVPIVMLDVGEGATDSPYVYRIVVSVEARARALAARGVADGDKRFAILMPQMPYATKAAAAFRAEVERLGGKVVAEITYDKDATAFVKEVKKLDAEKFDSLFVPDTAGKLELIAPQLAVHDLVVQPVGAKKPKRGRAIRLLSMAEGVSPRFLKGSGRYTNGAVLAPGFYPDAQDPVIGPFVTRFTAAYGDEPVALDAYAWDAALAVRLAVEEGAGDRDDVAGALAGTRLDGIGVTGDVSFGPTRARRDDGLLFAVQSDGAGGWEIRAQRPAKPATAATP